MVPASSPHRGSNRSPQDSDTDKSPDPATPEAPAKYVLQIKLDPEELEAVSRVAKLAFLPTATWARQTLLRSAGFHPAAAVAGPADTKPISAESPAAPEPRRGASRPRSRRTSKR